MEGENLAPARRVMLFLDGDTFPNLKRSGPETLRCRRALGGRHAAQLNRP
jgi:hypothetical protein